MMVAGATLSLKQCVSRRGGCRMGGRQETQMTCRPQGHLTQVRPHQASQPGPDMFDCTTWADWISVVHIEYGFIWWKRVGGSLSLFLLLSWHQRFIPTQDMNDVRLKYLMTRSWGGVPQAHPVAIAVIAGGTTCGLLGVSF